MECSKEDFNLFTIFLKETGQYRFMMNYLFPRGRTIESFLKDIEEIHHAVCNYNFGDILHLVKALGKSYLNFGHEYWEININPISKEWIAYYKLHKNNGKIC